MSGLGALAVAWTLWHIGWLPAHTFSATRFILYDQGSMLYVVERLDHGEVLYRDLNWQYGPLAAGWYWLWAQVAGNSPLTQVLASAGLMSVAWWLLAGLTVDAMGRRAGTVWAVVGLLPVLSPTGINAINGPHGALEMFLLAVTARVLAGNFTPHSRAWLVGLLVGVLQWVRFGPHAVAFLAVAWLEGWSLRAAGAVGREWWRQMGGWLGRALLAYGGMALGLAAYYGAVLPWPGVVEQLWPVHMSAHYAATYTQRWPDWPGWPGLAQVWLPVLAGLAGLLAWFWHRRRPAPATEPPRDAALAGLVFGPLYWAIGVVVLFRNDYTLTGHLWLVWPGLAVAWHLAPAKRRIALGVLLLPALLGHGAGLWRTQQEELAWHAEPRVMPNGQRLWFRTGEARRFAELGAAIGGNPAGTKLAVFIAGGGVHYFYGTQRVGRHWWYLPGFVRPWEAAAAEQALLQHEYLFVADFGQNPGEASTPGTLKLWVPLPDEMGSRLLSHLEDPRAIDGLGHVLRIRPTGDQKTGR